MILLILIVTDKQANCQCTGASIVIQNPGTDDISSYWGSGFTNSSVHIKTDFFIDNNFTITGSNVTIEPGIKIIVNPGFLLYITQSANSFSWLHACMANSVPTMWGGIEVLGTNISNGQLIIDGNTLIEDAETAVKVPDFELGLFNLINSTFNRNYIHVMIDFSTGNAYPLLSTIMGCKFYCKDGNGNNGTVLLPPYNGQRTLTAIHYSKPQNIQTPIEIGGGNIIDNAVTGIFMYFAIVRVMHNEILNTITGIHAEYDGDYFIEYNDIFRSDIGIEVLYSIANYLHISNNYLHYINQQGIVIGDGYFDNTLIRRNRLENMPDGILVFNVYGNSGNNSIIRIEGNELINDPVLASSHGITVTQPIIYPDNEINVIGNSIVNYEQGIDILQYHHSNVRGNSVVVPAPANNPPGYDIFGIKMAGCDRSGCNLNTVSSNDLGTLICEPWYYGIMIENCNETGVLCNNLGDPVVPNPTFNKNLWMAGLLNNNSVMGNVFQYERQYSIYLYYSDLGLGQQGTLWNTSDNEWHDAGGNCPAYDIFSEQSHQLGFTQFIVRNKPPWMHHDLPGNNGGVAANPEIVSYTYNPYRVCQYIKFGDGRIEEVVADSSIYLQGVSDALRWFLDEWYYRSLPNDSALFADSLLNAYWQQLEAGDHGSIKAFSDSIAAGMPGAYLNGFSSQNQVEEFIEEMLSIYGQIYNNGVLSVNAAQKAMVDSIAVLCPLKDGQGVYTARGLRALIDKTIYNYTSECSDTNSLRTANSALIIHASTSTIFTQSGRMESLPIFNEGSSIIKIFEISGKQVYSGRIINAQFHIPELSQGLYFYHAVKEGENIHSGKLIIVN